MDLGQAAPQASAFAGWLEKAKSPGQEPATQLEALHRAAEAAGDDIALFDEVAKLAGDTPNHHAWLSQLDSRASSDNSASAFIRLAHAHAMAGDWEAAHDSCERALSQSPRDVALRVDALSAANNAKRLDVALAHTRVLEDDESGGLDAVDRTWLVAFKAMLLGRLGEFEQAAAILRSEDVAQLPRERLNVALVDGFHAWVKALFEAQRWRELCDVIALMTRWNSASVRRLDLLSCQVVALFALGDPCALKAPAEEMLAAADDAVDRAQAHFFLGFAREADGELEAAAASAQIAYEALGQSADAQLARALHARACLALGRAQEALVSAEGIDPNLLPAHAVWLAHYLHGVALLRVGSFDPAAAVLRIAAERSAAGHERALALAELALAHEARDQLDAAVETAQRARALLDQNPRSAEADRARASTAMVCARAFGTRGRHEDVLRALRAAESVCPSLAEQLPFVELAWSALTALARKNEARALIERSARSVELADHPRFLLLVASHARSRAELDYAHTALTAATSLPTRLAHDLPAALSVIAAHLALGRTEQARALLESLESRDPRPDGTTLRFWRQLMLFHDRRGDARGPALSELDALAALPGVQGLLAHVMRHALCRASGHGADAQQSADQALLLLAVLPPVSPLPLIQVQLARAASLLDTGDRADVLEALTHAIEVDAAGEPIAAAFQDMARLLRATISFTCGRNSSALIDLQIARAGLRQSAERALQDDAWALANVRAALLECQVLNTLGRAEEALAALASISPEHHRLKSVALSLRGEALLGLQDWQRAAESFVLARAQLAELGGPPRVARVDLYARLGEARARLQNGDHTQAIALLQSALETQPELATDSVELWLLLGLGYHADRRLGPALQALERAQKHIDTTRREADAALGPAIAGARSAVLIALGKHTQALAVIDAVGPAVAQHVALLHNRGVAALELFRDARQTSHVQVAREALAAAALLGSRSAGAALRTLQEPTPSLLGWLAPAAALPTRAAGVAIALLAALVLFAIPLAGFWRGEAVDWRLYPFPAIATVLLVFLPRWRSAAKSAGEPGSSVAPMTDLAGSVTAAQGELLDAPFDGPSWLLPPHFEALMFGEIVRTPLAQLFATQTPREL